MPKDKTDSHRLILENAKQEFLQCGFEKASIRSIAKKSGLTGGALYKHFGSKEEIFNALVEPAYRKLLRLFDRHTDAVMNDMKENPEEMFADSLRGTREALALIYENFDAFRLMFNCAGGTRFEHIRETIVDIEAASARQFLKTAEKHGLNPAKLSDQEIHIFSTMSLTPMFEMITHGYPYKEAVKIAERMAEAQNYAWEKIIDLKLK